MSKYQHGKILETKDGKTTVKVSIGFMPHTVKDTKPTKHPL